VVIGEHFVESATKVFCFIDTSGAVVESKYVGNILVAESIVKRENGFDPVSVSLVPLCTMGFFEHCSLWSRELEHTLYYFAS
jgi:hypothetical protein